MNNLPGIGDPYWYEWFVGVKNVIKMLNPDNGIEYVIFQSSSYESIDDIVVGKKENIELCYQVKHVRTEKNLTFSSLIDKDEGSKKSLLTAIAEGWEKTNNISIIPILYSNKAIGIRSSTRTSKITNNKYKCLLLKDFFLRVKELVDRVEKWEDEEQLTQFIETHNMKDMKNSIISKINDGINTEKEICIGSTVYIPVKRKEGYEIIYSKNIKSNYSREKNFYSIMPSYKILYCEEKELFETDVIVKSICNKICGLTYGVNSNIRIALSNIFVNKLKLKLKSIEPLVFADDKNREVKFEWIMYPYRDNIQEAYVRYQTLYRWVCNKELFDEFLNKNNLQVIDNMDIQEIQI